MPRPKSISWSDLQTFLKCPKAFHDRMLNGWNAPTAKEAVANALHAIAEHNGDLEKAWKQVEQQLALLPEDERESARLELAQRAPTVAALIAKEPPSIREKVHRWSDPVSRWVWCAKPDKVRFYNDGFIKVMEITDYKDTDSVSSRLREQLFFFGLVLSKCFEHTGPIKLIVRRFKEQSRNSDAVPPVSVFNYSHHRTDAQLAKYRGYLTRIDAYLEAQAFPGVAGWYCEGCRLATTCQERDAYETLRRRGLPVVSPVVTAAAV